MKHPLEFDRPEPRPRGSWPTDGTVLPLNVDELLYYPAHCTLQSCADRPAAEVRPNLPAVTLQRGQEILAYYVCRNCFTAWWTPWPPQHT